jgi:hypothetical protein
VEVLLEGDLRSGHRSHYWLSTFPFVVRLNAVVILRWRILQHLG